MSAVIISAKIKRCHTVGDNAISSHASNDLKLESDRPRKKKYERFLPQSFDRIDMTEEKFNKQTRHTMVDNYV
jgi:hypothetical protein